VLHLKIIRVQENSQKNIFVVDCSPTASAVNKRIVVAIATVVVASAVAYL